MKPIEFLTKVWKDNAHEGCYFFVSTKDKDGSWKDHAVPWEDASDTLRRLFSRDHDNWYFCPNPFSKPVRRVSAAMDTRYLWADLDEADPNEMEPQPSVAWQSSPGRYSAIWKLKDSHSPEEAVKSNRALTYNVQADKGGWDYTQVLRIPGTRNRKYKEAPHVRLMWFHNKSISMPSPVAVKDLVEKYKSKLPAFIRQYLNAKHIPVGPRSEGLWKIEHYLAKAGATAPEIFQIVKHSAWNKYRGRRDEDERLNNEIAKVKENYVEPEAPKHNSKYEGSIVRLSDVEAEHVTWLWYPYIPRGKLTLLEGDPGLGKSWISLAIASYLSNGKRLPNQPKPVSGRALFMSAEDGLGDTIRPRLDSMGANVSKIFAYVDPITFNAEGVEEIERQVLEIRPTVLFIDPLVAYMGGEIDLHKANHTREMLARLAAMAERHNIAVVAVRHLTKGTRDKSIYRGIGSIDITAAARSVMYVGQDPEDEENRVIAHIKSNLAPLGPSISYSLHPGKDRPFTWEGTSKLKATDLAQTDKEIKSGTMRAEKFLHDRLLKGPMRVDHARRDAEAQGISDRNLRRAREKLGAEGVKKDGYWYWTIDNATPPKNTGDGRRGNASSKREAGVSGKTA